MKIESARAIPITEILAKIGLKPSKQRQNDCWYYSPFRKEKTPSFHVNTIKNVWFDFGENKGGDSVNFVCAYLQSVRVCHTVSDALRWLDNMFQNQISFPVLEQDKACTDSDVILKSSKPLTHIALIRYMESRGISQSIARTYLKEIRVYSKNSQKEYFAAAIRNEEGGYDYRNPYFKGCTLKKSITFIRGSVPKPGGIHIFEGFMDFLSAVMQNDGKKFEDDTIILNSLSCMQEATGYIRGFGYRNAWTWLDNDEAGKKATNALGEFFSKEKIKHISMNSNYQPHKDVNAFHMAKLGLEGK